MTIILAGCGALGSQIALHLALPSRDFLLIDDDRVEENNLLTSAYFSFHIGALKTTCLSEMLYRKSNCHVSEITSTLTGWKQEFNGAEIIIDTFDNFESRSIWKIGITIPVVHVGVSEGHTGSIIWNEDYQFSRSEFKRGENPVCTHELGRNILRLTATVAAGVIEEFLATGEKRSLIVTDSLSILG